MLGSVGGPVLPDCQTGFLNHEKRMLTLVRTSNYIHIHTACFHFFFFTQNESLTTQTWSSNMLSQNIMIDVTVTGSGLI